MKNAIKRLAVSALGLTTAGGLSLGIAPTPAHADASYCGSYDICVHVTGSANYIGTVTIKINRYVCQFQGRFTVYNASGGILADSWGPQRTGCNNPDGWTWYPRKQYPGGTRTCIAGYSQGTYLARGCFQLD
jgi:hypothetical protein